MKVLKPGKRTEWSMEVECTGKGNGLDGCGALLEVNKDDLYKTESFDYGGGHDVFCTITCAYCGVETDIDVPRKVFPTINKKTFFANK